MTELSYEPGRCAVCGHADAKVVAEQDDLRSEVEWLWEYHQRRLRADTPPEHLRDRVAFSEYPPLRLVRCRECGLVYRNPVERLHELEQIYARDTTAPAVLQSLHSTQLPAVREQARHLRQTLGRSGTGIEVGSYVGAFLSAARECELQIEGVDINRDVNAFTRSLGFTVHDGDLASIDAKQQYDCIAIWNTFDQLADPRGVVNAARRLLRPGGMLAVRVPNGAYYARMRRRRAGWPLLAQNNLLSFPYRWGFTPKSLARLLTELGFTIRRIRPDVLVPIADEWTLRWAAREERVMKRAMLAAAIADRTLAPWFEIYAVV
ncbi:MAG TPA: class I SAM-dependent methyltransferase [Gemmatimonadaceae bacterium]